MEKIESSFESKEDPVVKYNVSKLQSELNTYILSSTVGAGDPIEIKGRKYISTNAVGYADIFTGKILCLGVDREAINDAPWQYSTFELKIIVAPIGKTPEDWTKENFRPEIYEVNIDDEFSPKANQILEETITEYSIN